MNAAKTTVSRQEHRLAPHAERAPTRAAVLILALAMGAACGHGRVLAGTSIPDTEINREIVDTIEEYRMRIVQKNVDGLLLLASEKYFEDGGTPQANDDYGYAGLSTILSSRLQRVESIRYEIQYKNINMRKDGRVEVEAYLSGAFELQGDVGERFRRVSDYHRFILERSTNGGTSKWRFLSGM